MATLAQISASVGRHIFLQNVARGLAGDTGSPRSHRLVKALAIPPLRIIAGEVKRQLSRTAHCFAKTVCTHEQALTVLGLARAAFRAARTSCARFLESPALYGQAARGAQA